MKTIAVIDGDSICYLCSKDTLEESLENVDSLIKSIGEMTNSTHYYLFLSKGKYFRHQINTDYKGKRKYASPLKYLRTLKSYLMEQYNAVAIPNVEADDMVAYTMHTEVEENKENTYINCSIDKDVLKTVPGLNFNYRTYESQEVSKKDALKFMYKQVLMGDSGDNITGIPGVGEKTAAAILELAETSEELRKVVLDAYFDYYKEFSGQSVFHFQKNFRQIYLLRTKEDFLNEVGTIPTLPNLSLFSNE
jgi:5'-3' exonuclease